MSDADDDARLCYELAVKAWHEQSIRAGWLEPDPSKPHEVRWSRQGVVPSSQLDAVKQ